MNSKKNTKNARLHLNELPWSPWDLGLDLNLRDIDINRYPDSDYSELKTAIANYYDLKKEQVVLGNGSDELILLLLAVFLKAGDDLVTHAPTFSEYQRAAKLLGMNLWQSSIKEDLSTEVNDLLTLAKSKSAKMIILCRPNNPTGEMIPLSDVKRLLSNFDGYVLLDEAYIEFSEEDPRQLVDLLIDYPKAIILRTFSKAFGLAGLRMGYSLSSPELAKALDNERPPYNVNVLSQAITLEALKRPEIFKARMEAAKQERRRVLEALRVLKVDFYPTQTNFILLKNRTPLADQDALKQLGIQVRVFSEAPLLKAVRFSLGSPEENNRLLNYLAGEAS